MSGQRASATPEDVDSWLKYHLDNVEKGMLIELNRTKTDWIVRGNTGNSRFAFALFDIVEETARRGIDMTLGQCKRAKHITNIDHQALRSLMEERLATFIDAIKKPLLPDDGSLAGDFRQIVQNRRHASARHSQFFAVRSQQLQCR
jgi:hypothetical protein